MRVIALVTLVDGEGSHPPGSTVEVGEGEAETLIRRGFARRPKAGESASSPASGDATKASAEGSAPSRGADASSAAPKPGTPPASAEERVAAIVDAIALLEPGNETHFNKAGKPELGALAEILGWRPVAAERDAAFAQAQG
jgi:hypothetical protein